MIQNLDCDIWDTLGLTLYVARVEIIVTYTAGGVDAGIMTTSKVWGA